MRPLSIALLALMALAPPVLLAQQPLRVGLAEAVLEPPSGFDMWGYTPRPNGGVLDPLMARVVLFDADEKRVALVTLDLGRTPARPQMDSVREKVRLEARVDDVIFMASHTHSGPYLKDEYEDGVPAWELAAMERIADAVIRAAGETFEARWGVGYGRVEVGFNRRYVLPDGSVRMLWANPTRISTYPVDPEVTVLRIDDAAGRVRALLVGYACHPVVFGPDNLEYSADFPGAMARSIAESHPDSPMTAFLQGAPGDVNPFLDKRELPADAVRLMKEVGEELAAEVMRTAARIEPAPSREATLELRRTEWQWHHRLDRDDGYRGDLTVLLLDDTLGLVGLPGEPFVEFQLDLKRRRPVPSRPLCRVYQWLCGVLSDHPCSGRGGLRCRPDRRSGRGGGGGAIDDEGLSLPARDEWSTERQSAKVRASGRCRAIETPLARAGTLRRCGGLVTVRSAGSRAPRRASAPSGARDRPGCLRAAGGRSGRPRVRR